MKLVEKVLESIERINHQQIEWNRESHQKGFISDGEKIHWLKNEIYRRVQIGKDTTELRRALREIAEQLERDRAYRNSFYVRVDSLCKGVVGIALLVTGVSFLIQFSGACRGNNSLFCDQSRIIPEAIDVYFQDK